MAPAAIVAVVGETENCAASAPPVLMPVMDRLALPVLEIVKVFCDKAPTAVLSIFSDVADRLMPGVAENAIT